MEWLKWLGDLSPVALFVVAVWVIATKIMAPVLRNHEQVVNQITDSHEKQIGKLADSLDRNTEAVEQAVKQNEQIIRNHLAQTERKWEVVREELMNVRTSINTMNNRRRSTDLTPGAKSDRVARGR